MTPFEQGYYRTMKCAGLPVPPGAETVAPNWDELMPTRPGVSVVDGIRGEMPVLDTDNLYGLNKKRIPTSNRPSGQHQLGPRGYAERGHGPDDVMDALRKRFDVGQVHPDHISDDLLQVWTGGAGAPTEELGALAGAGTPRRALLDADTRPLSRLRMMSSGMTEGPFFDRNTLKKLKGLV